MGLLYLYLVYVVALNAKESISCDVGLRSYLIYFCLQPLDAWHSLVKLFKC